VLGGRRLSGGAFSIRLQFNIERNKTYQVVTDSVSAGGHSGKKVQESNVRLHQQQSMNFAELSEPAVVVGSLKSITS
jgi:hypothetical protein